MCGACARSHVCDGERLVRWVVEETLVKSGREEAYWRTAMNQGESQQAANVKV